MEQLGRTIKANFSARWRADAGKAAEAGLGPRAPARKGADAFAAAELAVADEAAGDGPGPSEPITARLPRRKLAGRTKLLIGAACAAAVIVAGIFAGQMVHAGRRSRWRAADAAYAVALTSYKNADFAGAGEGFDRLAAQYPDTDSGSQAAVMSQFARAYACVAGNDWAGAKAAEDAAASEIRRVQDGHDNLSQWARQKSSDLEEFKTFRVRSWTFFDAMEASNQAARVGQFARARAELNRRLLNFTPTPQQEAKLNAFIAELDARELEAQIDSMFADAADLAGQGNFDRAKETHDQIKQVLDHPDAKEKLLPDKLKELSDRLAAARLSLAADQQYRQAMAEAQAAQESGDKAGELAAVRKAAEARPALVDPAKLRSMELAVALDQGRALLDASNVAEAERAFGRALELDPGNSDAQAGIEAAKAAAHRLELIAAAKADMQAGEFSTALDKSSQAAAIGSGPDLAAMIVECRFRIGLAGAEKLRNEGQYDQALAAYEALRTIKADEAANIDAWQAEVRLKQSYQQELALGDDALAKRQWLEAIKHYREAKALIPTDQADQKMTDVRYAENLYKGQTAMSQDDLSGAKGYFTLAKKYKDTPEINDLLKDVDQKLQQQQK